MPLPVKRFRVVNEGFVCEGCQCIVLPTTNGAPRNHCPSCLASKHVDVNPGDRAHPCQGAMEAIGVYLGGKRSAVILHECRRCGARTKSKAILTDKDQPDNFELIVELSQHPITER